MNSVVAVVGASGFLGSACSSALEQAGHRVTRVHAPRLTTDDPRSARPRPRPRNSPNCYEGPKRSSIVRGNLMLIRDDRSLAAANSVLPGVVGAAARQAGVPRYVHVSSAVVQGRRPFCSTAPTPSTPSPHARSTAGERAARTEGPALTIIYRPPSVHGPTRRVTNQLSRIARSPVATVARPGTAPTPQTHIDNVADALVLLARMSATPPPGTVHHPWEGHTTAGLLRLLGDGRVPRLLPARLAHGVVAALGELAQQGPDTALHASYRDYLVRTRPSPRAGSPSKVGNR